MADNVAAQLATSTISRNLSGLDFTTAFQLVPEAPRKGQVAVQRWAKCSSEDLLRGNVHGNVAGTVSGSLTRR